MAGFFFSIDGRLSTNDMARDYYRNQKGCVCINRLGKNVDDVYYNLDEGDKIILMGVGTLEIEWMSTMMRDKHTVIFEKREVAMSKRTRFPENE